MQIPLARPWIGPDEEAAVAEVLRSGWVSSGPRGAEFEARLAGYLGSPWVATCNSGTSAILLALKAMGVGPGMSVVAPAFTCAATALPAQTLGARVLFSDVDPHTFNSSWEHIEPVIESDTRVVILVHMFGLAADVPRVAAECASRGISLLEDACLALGTFIDGRHVGTWGHAGVLSFHPRKMITTGEGGAVFTSDETLARMVQQDRSYGAASSAWSRFQSQEGTLTGFSRNAFNFKMTDMQAAMGLVQMQRLPEALARRASLARRYREGLQGLPLQLPPEGPHAYQAWVCSSDRVDSIRAACGQAGVAVSDAAQWMPGLPVFDMPGSSTPNARRAAREAFALPLYPTMSAAQVDRVIQVVRAAVE